MPEEVTTVVAQEEIEEGEINQTETTTEEPIQEEAAQEESDEIKLPSPKKKTAEDRIKELTYRWREEQRKNEQLRKEKETPQNQTQIDRPKIEHFNSQEEYEDALLSWHESKKEKERTEEKQKTEIKQAVEKFEEKAVKLREVYHDFDEVINLFPSTETMRLTLLKSDEGALMAYYLGRPENHSLAERIANQSPEKQIYELGKLETKLILAQKQTKTTKAPEPVKPVGMGAPPVDESALSDDEWFKLQQQRRLENIQKKYGG